MPRYNGKYYEYNENENRIILPGLSEDETRYFQYLLTRSFKEITEEKWKDLTILNQKTLKFMYDNHNQKIQESLGCLEICPSCNERSLKAKMSGMGCLNPKCGFLDCY
jgi:hypothetical protein